GFELEEALRVEVAADRLVDRVTDAERLLEGGAPEIEIAVLEALLLAGVDLVLDLEGRRVGLVEDRELDRTDLDVARGELRILVAASARDDAAHADDPLRPRGLGLLVGVLRLRIFGRGGI